VRSLGGGGWLGTQGESRRRGEGAGWDVEGHDIKFQGIARGDYGNEFALCDFFPLLCRNPQAGKNVNASHFTKINTNCNHPLFRLQVRVTLTWEGAALAVQTAKERPLSGVQPAFGPGPLNKDKH